MIITGLSCHKRRPKDFGPNWWENQHNLIVPNSGKNGWSWAKTPMYWWGKSVVLFYFILFFCCCNFCCQPILQPWFVYFSVSHQLSLCMLPLVSFGPIPIPPINPLWGGRDLYSVSTLARMAILVHVQCDFSDSFSEGLQWKGLQTLLYRDALNYSSMCFPFPSLPSKNFTKKNETIVTILILQTH